MADDFEESYRFPTPSKEALAKADEEVRIMVITRGMTADDRPYWAYLAIIPSKFQDFRNLEFSDEPFRLSDYGEVIRSGIGLDPPPQVVWEMEQEHGVNHSFEEDVIEHAQELEKRERLLHEYTRARKKPEDK